MKNTSRVLLLCLLLPLVGLAGYVAYAEARIRAGVRWRIPIAGYDPRDLLSGHYLTFRFDWERLGATTGDCPGDANAPCHVCLQGGDDPREGGRFRPVAGLASREEVRRCDGFVDAAEAWGSRRHYIPEGDGARLEALIRDHKAAVIISLSGAGKAQVVELTIDETPEGADGADAGD